MHNIIANVEGNITSQIYYQNGNATIAYIALAKELIATHTDVNADIVTAASTTDDLITMVNNILPPEIKLFWHIDEPMDKPADDNSDNISITWNIEDVRTRAEERELDYDLSDEDCRKILKEAERRHDSNFGITWETFDFYTDNLINENLKVNNKGKTKTFYVKDKTRGIKLGHRTGEDLLSWPPEENYDGKGLYQWINNADEGDTWENAETVITCLG